MCEKLVLLSLVILGLSGCNSGDSGGSKTPAPTQQGNGQSCVPESDLMKPSQAIVGGQKVTEGDADSKKVVLLYSATGTDSGEICTAAAIAPDVLLTAAHCIAAAADHTLVFTHTSLSCESGFDVRTHGHLVSEVVANAEYDKNLPVDQSQNDVALVFLKESLPWDYPVYHIADPARVVQGSPLEMYGYGQVGYQKGGSGILRKIEISADSYTILNDEGKVQIDQSNGTGICSGDSGGPSLVWIDGEWQILGVNSYVMRGMSSDMCEGMSYLALANKYRDWISQEMSWRGRYLGN